MKLGYINHSPSAITKDARTRNTQIALRDLTRKAQALGADLSPEDVKVTEYQNHMTHSTEIHVVPDAAVEAAVKVFNRVHHDGYGEDPTNAIRAALEAAYPATRADQLHRFANELEAALETGDSPHQLPYDWRDDAKLLEARS